jgi:iron complex outermembrane receptor protein
VRLSTLAMVLLGSVRSASAAPLELAEIEDVEALSLSELLERPVIAASRYAQDPGSSPTLVSSVDAELIERLGFRSISEALRGVRGVYTSNDRNYSYIGMRGFSVPGDYNTRLALTIDGHGINDPIYEQGASGIELGLPMNAIDHIEVVRGSAWTLYGASAMLGAIAVVSARGATRPGLRVATSSRAGLETTDDPAGRPTVAPRGQDISASYGAVAGGVDVFVAASYLFDAGLKAISMPELTGPDLVCVDPQSLPRPCDGVVHGNDGEQSGSAYAVVRAGGLSMHALAARRHKRVATAPFETLIDDPGGQTYDHRIYADAEYAVSGPRGDVIGRIATDYYGYRGDYPYDLARPGAEALPASRGLNRDVSAGRRVTAELRGRYKRARLGRYLSDVQLGGGGELGLGHARQENFDDLAEGRSVYLDSTARSRLAAATVQSSARAFDHLVGFVALRGVYYPDSFGGTVNPQGGLVLDGGEHGRVRASIARGFRAPNAYELDLAPSQGLRSELRPERSDTRELSLERYLGKHLRTQLVVYSQRMTDLIALTLTDDGLRLFANRDSIRGHGVEAELEGRWNDVRVRASYAWQRSSDQHGEILVNSPRSVAYGSLLAPIVPGRLDLALETSYIGARRSSNAGAVGAALISNLSFTAHDVIDQLDVTLGATNLFDERGSDPGSEDHRQTLIPRDPRVVWLRLQLELER